MNQNKTPDDKSAAAPDAPAPDASVGQDGKKPATTEDPQAEPKKAEQKIEEIDGRDGPDPTRYGDWERNGILSDF